MARKGLFQGSGGQQPPSPARPVVPVHEAAPLSLLRSDLRNLVRDIDPDLIDGSPFQDRIPGQDPDLDRLVESVRSHGQLVPAMVRPAGVKGRFEIVYGRRRLAAVREAGLPLKAVIHDIDAAAALIAQGAENNNRLDPSFIEKAVFAWRLDRSGLYDRPVIAEVLGTHPSGISRMCAIVEAIGEDLILAIGPCHELGRRPWQELAEAIQQHAGAPVAPEDLAGIDRDTERFARVLDRYRQEPALEEAEPQAPVRVAEPAATSAADMPAWQRRRRHRLRHDHGVALLKSGRSGVALVLPAQETDEDLLDWAIRHPEDVLSAVLERWSRTTGS